MREVIGDIWDYRDKGWIVVPINLTTQLSGEALMLFGVAGQARKMFPGIARVVNQFLLLRRDFTNRYSHLYCFFTTEPPINGGLIFFPTQDGWRERARIVFIENGLRSLKKLPIYGNIYLPILGIGHGRLQEEDVLWIMQEELRDDKFILVRRGPEVEKRYPDSFGNAAEGTPQRPSATHDYSLKRERQKRIEDV